MHERLNHAEHGGFTYSWLDLACSAKESVYTTCAALGCNKSVKRGEKCGGCGWQN
jgi:hypothetical protein